MNTSQSPTTIPQAELIERWQNAQRVLESMPEHERLNHWDMSTWGRKTKCGTVHCAAGGCGLDPWFRARGFKLDFNLNGDASISNPTEFFGYEGTARIFLNVDARPVERVIDEVHAFVGELTDGEALALKIGAPAIGQMWSAQGGVFAGIIRRLDGTSYALIVGPEMEGRATWQGATNWAGELVVDSFRDFTLQTRMEGPRLYGAVKHLFKPEWYWSSTQHPGLSSNAYVQGFSHGGQSYSFKGSNYRARAVRRLPI